MKYVQKYREGRKIKHYYYGLKYSTAICGMTIQEDKLRSDPRGLLNCYMCKRCVVINSRY